MRFGRSAVLCLGLLSSWSIMGGHENSGPRVIPFVFEAIFSETLNLTPGDQVWLELDYRASPDGPSIHQEMGEKLWWIQDQPVLILGATGLPLPASITRRATAFLHIYLGGESVVGSPFSLFPQRDGTIIDTDPSKIKDALAKRLANVDASYLSQVAHFLAGNLGALDVQGTSYSISSVGTVIDSDGDWVGGRLGTLSPGLSVFVGLDAGAVDDGSSNRNTFVGYRSAYYTTIGEHNTALGYGTLFVNTEGNENTALGYRALRSNTTGEFNTASGSGALYSNTTGDDNTATGYQALYSNIDGDNNTASGQNALHDNTTGSGNTALGVNALMSNTTGDSNTAVGFLSLDTNTSGYQNTGLGFRALASNTTGHGNTAVNWALYSNTEGDSNTAIGNSAAYSNTTGSYNAACGNSALHSNRTGDHNTAFGYSALSENRTGRENTAVGSNSGPQYEADSLENTTALGFLTKVTADNQVRIGNDDVTSIGGYADWSNISDGRFKTDVQENVLGLDFILQLRPVTYRFDSSACQRFVDPSSDHKAMVPPVSDRQSGFIAQEVAAAVNKLGVPFSGVDTPSNEKTPHALRYAQFVVPLVKAIQEQQEQIDELRKLIEEIRNELEQ